MPRSSQHPAEATIRVFVPATGTALRAPPCGRRPRQRKHEVRPKFGARTPAQSLTSDGIRVRNGTRRGPERSGPVDRWEGEGSKNPYRSSSWQIFGGGGGGVDFLSWRAIRSSARGIFKPAMSSGRGIFTDLSLTGTGTTQIPARVKGGLPTPIFPSTQAKLEGAASRFSRQLAQSSSRGRGVSRPTRKTETPEVPGNTPAPTGGVAASRTSVGQASGWEVTRPRPRRRERSRCRRWQPLHPR